MVAYAPGSSESKKVFLSGLEKSISIWSQKKYFYLQSREAAADKMKLLATIYLFLMTAVAGDISQFQILKFFCKCVLNHLRLLCFDFCFMSGQPRTKFLCFNFRSRKVAFTIMFFNCVLIRVSCQVSQGQPPQVHQFLSLTQTSKRCVYCKVCTK